MTSPSRELKTFVEEVLLSAGALAEPRDGEAWEVLLPLDLAARLGGDLVRVTLSPDRPGELVALGSPTLDALADWAMSHGRVTMGYVDADVRKVLTLEDVLAQVRCYNCRPVMESASVDLHHQGLFTFRVTYLLEERHEELRQACVHLHLAKEVAPYQTTPTELPPDLEGAPLPPLAPAYATACRVISREASARAAEVRSQGERVLGREVQRITAYFDAYEQEVRRRLAATTDGERRQRLESRLAAAKRERAAKIEDARGKYHLAVEARLVALAVWCAPAIRAGLSLLERGGAGSGGLTLFWDAVHRRLELPLCPCCGQELRTLCLCPECHQPICRACLKSCRHPVGVAHAVSEDGLHP